MSKVKNLIESNATPAEIIAKTESYCPLVWSHFHVATSGNTMPCCVGQWDHSLGNINEQNFDEIWHGEEYKKIRKALYNDEKVPHCTTCYKKEEASNHSLRHEAIKKYHDVSKDMVMSTKEDGTAEKSKPVFLDIRFSNICNMRCRMCGHFSSSKWFADAQKLDKIGLSHYKNDDDIAIISIKDSKALLDRLDEYLPYVKEIYFAGGEPLIMEEHYTLLNRMIELGLTKTHIRYSTNLSMLKYKNIRIVDIWKNFSKVECAASIDTYGQRAEHIRKDTIWSNIESNIQIIRRDAPHVNVNISPTLQIMNAWTVCDLQEDWIKKGYIEHNTIFWNILQIPSFYNLQILPLHLKKEIVDIWMNHKNWLENLNKGSVREFIKPTMEWMMAGEENPKSLIKLCENSKAIDKIRGEDTRATFPELNYVWEKYWDDS